MSIRRTMLVLMALAAVAAGSPAAAASKPPKKAPRSFVSLHKVDPSILLDIRYYTKHNFVGRRIHGYRAPMCILTRRAATGLARVQAAVVPQGYTLKVYDCYRPQRAVNHFVRWARRLHDQRMKREFYPRVDKRRVFELGYVAHRSGHSRGSTVDITLVRLPPRAQPAWDGRLRSCFASYRRRFADSGVNMGTGYDCIDPRAHTSDPRIKGRAHRNRMRLKRALERRGFEPYANEWWHFTLRREPYPEKYFDFPVTRESLR
jgi:D-alanyl-D-alanine dipeptidase